MYSATVYQVMFGSPSDIEEEIQVAFQVLNHWNSLHSEQSKIVLLPLHWSVSSYPAMGKHPQKLLNEQVVEKSDLLVCIFGTRLGSPTDTEISGTVEEIKEHRKAGKDVMVFFKLSVDDITSVDPQQLQKIKDFKESIKNEALWCEFSNTADFEKKFEDSLQLYVSKHWTNSNIVENGNGSSTKIEFSEDEQNILTKWIQSNDMYYHTEEFTYGMLHFFGTYHQLANNGLERVKMDDFVERMKKAGFIEEYEKDKFGRPIYTLKKAAYDYLDTINGTNKSQDIML